MNLTQLRDRFEHVRDLHRACVQCIALSISDYERAIHQQERKELFDEAKALGEQIQELQRAEPYAVRPKPWEIMP